MTEHAPPPHRQRGLLWASIDNDDSLDLDQLSVAEPAADGTISRPAAEGKLVRGFQGLDVGDRVHVELIHTDFEHGFVDFARS